MTSNGCASMETQDRKTTDGTKAVFRRLYARSCNFTSRAIWSVIFRWQPFQCVRSAACSRVSSGSLAT